MQDQLYNNKILTLIDGLDKKCRLSDPDISVTVDSPLCGSRIKIDLKYDFNMDIVTEYGHEVRACALGQAAAAVMIQHVVGCSEVELISLCQQMENMLKRNGPVPTGKWSDLAAFEMAQNHKSRHASILLSFKGVVKAISDLRERHSLSLDLDSKSH